jgi:hypothetical protein
LNGFISVSRGLEHSCFVSSFVGLNLDTLEERRLIVSRGSQNLTQQGKSYKTRWLITYLNNKVCSYNNLSASEVIHYKFVKGFTVLKYYATIT